MLKIWGRTNSFNVQKVMWTADELGLAHERIDAGGAFGGLETDSYTALNPNRRIPVVEDGELALWESNAIVRYLAAKYGSGTLWPEDPGLRSLADRWMDWQITTLQPQLHIIFWGLIRTPEAERDMAAIGTAVWRSSPSGSCSTSIFGCRRFVAGPELTMGDIPLGCAFWRYQNLPIDRPTCPTCNWFERSGGAAGLSPPRHAAGDLTGRSP
jgi:glutathione S-transferase